MNKRANKELFLAKIVIAIALVAIFVAGLWMFIGQDTVAVQSAKEAYSLYMIENPEATDKDFIYIYEDTVIVAIRNGKVVRKEYATEADAVKAALGSKDGANYSLAGTGNGKLFVVKLFEKTDDIYALGTSTLATGAEKLTIKVVSNGMIFATFDIPAEAIDRKQSPVGVTIKKINPEDNIKLGKNEKGFAYDIDVDNLVENNTSLIKVTMNGPKGLSVSKNKKAITVYHKNKAIASTYDPAKGEISFETTDFSPYTFTYQMVTVNSLEELRKELGREASGNIILGDDFEGAVNGVITIDLTTQRQDVKDKDTNEDLYYEETKGDDPYSKYDDEKVYYAKAIVSGENAFFGALVIGDMTIDLNGKTIVFKGDTTKNDAALFAVGNNSSLTIVDSSEGKTGTIKVPYDQHAIWSVDYTSAVSIHGGNFVKEAKSGTQTNRALLYSSGGKINVYVGSSFDFGADGNGGFNVLDAIKTTRIWIHEGVLLKNSAYCSDTDSSRIVLVGGANLIEEKETVDEKEVSTGWFKVQGQKLQVAVPHTDKMLYRVGNKNAFPLRVFFEALVDGNYNDVTVRIVDIIKTDETIAGNKDNNTNKFDPANGYYGSIKDEHLVDTLTDSKNGKYTYTDSSADGWGYYTIQFKNFSGPVRLELCNADQTIVYTSINLEVIDGYNIYSGTTVYSPSATNGDVCLLEDVDVCSANAISNAITISGGRALFGNGFTINDKRYFEGSTYDYTTGNYGIIKVTNGAIENVKILGYQSKTVGKVYNNNHGYAPTVLISCDTNGSANIYNSYIFGGYSPIVAQTGTVLLDNVTLDGGGIANMQIISADVTLQNCTTTTNTINPDKEALGIIVCSPSAKIKLEGTFTQHNWLRKDQLPSQTVSGVTLDFKTILNDAVYTDDGFTSDSRANMGIVFADIASTEENFTETIVRNNNMLTDCTGNNYGFTATLSVLTKSATGYLPKVEDGKTYDVTTHPNHEDYAPSQYRIYKPSIFFDTSENSANKVTETKTEWFKYDASTNAISIGLPPKTTEKVLYLSDLALKRYGHNGTYDLRYSYKDASGNVLERKIDATMTTVPLVLSGSEHKLILRAAVSGCTPSGVRDDSVFEVYTYVIPITITTHDYAAPALSAAETTGSEHFWIERGFGDKDYSEAFPIYNGITVMLDYLRDEDNNMIPIDLSECLIVPDKNGATCTVFFDAEYDGQLKGCSMKINLSGSEVSSGWYLFAQCKYNSNSNTKMYYYHERIGQNYPGRDNIDKAFDITVDYTFYDAYNQPSNTVTVKYSFGNKSSVPAKTSLSNFNGKNAKIGDSSGGGGCVTPDTLVTLADGTKKEIQHVTYEDQLLVWNYYTGKYDVVPASIVMNHGYDHYKIVTLNFADGTTVNTINGHGFFDANERKYVILSDNNAADYIGHDFVKVDGDGYTTTKLVSYSVKTEYTESWSILTAGHYNCILEDMWTVTPAEVEGSPDYLMPFVVCADMKYDAAKMQADIAKYGLYTYADFAQYMTEEQFNALGLSTWKVAVGKGYITWEDILYLISIHIG